MELLVAGKNFPAIDSPDQSLKQLLVVLGEVPAKQLVGHVCPQASPAIMPSSSCRTPRTSSKYLRRVMRGTMTWPIGHHVQRLLGNQPVDPPSRTGIALVPSSFSQGCAGSHLHPG